MRTTPPAEQADQLSGSAPPTIEIRPLVPGEDATAFRTLNEEWITRHFALEEKDIETLGDPENTILRKGGHIFMVYLDAKPVGCVALIPIGAGVFELSKMAVTSECRGQGIGRRLIEYAIRRARMLGASSLFLGCSTKLPSAIHLYESAGFRHVQPESLPPIPYTRANVFMRLTLENGK
jgi:N-acetylglutamate synthase-like GNAT family acetyltransferase